MSDSQLTPEPPPSGSSIIAVSGVDGSGGSGVNLENTGTPVPGNPHLTLNFTGSGVTVVDDGGGVATITVTSGSSIYFNVKDYGAVGDGSHDDSAAVRAAMAAAVAAGGGTVYFPNGTYVLSAEIGEFWCINLAANVTFLGQSRDGAILLLAPHTGNSVRMFYVQSTDSTISTLTIDGNKSHQDNDDVHRAGVFIWSGIRTRLLNITSQNWTGDGLYVFQDSTDTLIEGCYVLSNDRDGIAISGSDSRRTTVRNCICVGSVAQQIDTEPTEIPLYDVLIEGCYLSGGGVSTDYPLTISGAGSGIQSVGFMIQNNWIDGPVYAVWADRVSFIGNRILNNNALAVDCLDIDRQCTNWIVTGNHFESQSANTSAEVISVSGTATGDRPDAIQIIGNTIITSASIAQSGVHMLNVVDVTVANNVITGNAGCASTYGVLVSTSDPARPSDTVQIQGNQISDFGVGILQGGTTGTELNLMVVSDNVFASPSNIMTTGIELDDAGIGMRTAIVQRCTVIGNSLSGPDSAWTTMIGEYPITAPILIGGSYEGGGIWNCAGTPNGQIIEQIGAMAMQRDGAGGIVGWIKTGNAGMNTGWQSINVT